ncbi:MAG: hypothetical protein L6R42_002489 [Xanthoria sp. 1 TBL-2021]|nr:MAG: hypothetical protein L6R42_002489 [Xanthoria sp. 1 TBL-2021]
MALPQSQSNAITNTQPSTKLCGNDDRIILEGAPWLVANSLHGAAAMVGLACTYYERIDTSAGGNSRVVWRSTTAIEDVEDTNNICKGYANVGLISNLENTVSSISSIPATYDWTRTSSSAFKGRPRIPLFILSRTSLRNSVGNICFDFILGNSKGDSTSTSAQELMLWLEWEGGQLPIGWNNGPKATISNLFGTSWKLYEDINIGNGMMVHSLLPDTQFSGSFAGDLKDWFEELIKLRRFSEEAYVNIGNAG